jgi:hypothetical protein
MDNLNDLSPTSSDCDLYLGDTYDTHDTIVDTNDFIELKKSSKKEKYITIQFILKM